VLAGALLMLFFAWNVRRVKCEMKCSDTPCLSDIPTFKLINETCALMIEHSVFSVMVGLIVVILYGNLFLKANKQVAIFSQ